MAENLEHPGSFVGDTVEEFRKLPPWGKAALAAGIGLLVYLFWRSRQNSAQQAASQAVPAATGSQSPYPNVNGVPLLPSNVNPVYDPNGQLVSFQTAATPTSGTTPPVQSPTSTAKPPVVNNPKPAGAPNPLIPYGQYRGPSYSNLKPNTYYTYNGTRYLLNTGPNGRLYGTPSGGQQVLLYAPQSAYHKAGSNATHYHTVNLMSDPLVYWVSAHPHTPTSVPGA